MRGSIGSLTTALALPLIVLAATAMDAAPPARSSLAEKLQKEYETRQAKFAQQVLVLAQSLASQGLDADARAVAQVAEAPDPDSILKIELPETTRPAPAPGWPQQLRSLEEGLATDLFKLAEKSKINAQMNLAWRLICETAYRNPDHEKARAALGYVKYENNWTTPFRRQMLERGNVWHDEFGWLPKDDLPRYLAGERRAKDRRWVTKARDESLRADFANGWEIDSEHFHVKSNHSLERTVQLSVELEKFHDYFLREFSAVFMTPQQSQMLIQTAGVVPSRRHVVHYFRKRQEFQARLMAKQPEAAFSDGMYMPDDRVAYFFDRPGEEDKVAETMFHEVTHQILTESARKPIGIDNWVDGDFWLVEGLACYMESFRPGVRGGTVGDPGHVRIEWARRFVAEKDFFVPLERFTAMTQRDFQCADLANGPERVDRLQKHYAQAAGVTHFFMHAEHGRYREALIRYLAAIYSADQRVRKNNATLAELTGVPFAELDRQYVAYIQSLKSPVVVSEGAR